MIRSRSLCLSLTALCLTSLLWSCAGSSGGKATRPRGPSPASAAAGPTLAMVGGHPITRHDVDSVLAAAPASIREDYLADPDQYKMLVERIAQQETIYRAALRDGIDRDPSYVADVAAQQRSLLMKHYYQKTVQALPAIPDSAVHQYYEAHPAEFSVPARVRVRHILVPTQARAREVIKKLRTASWDQVCPRYSSDKVTAKSGGLLGFVTPEGDDVPGVGKAPSIVAAAFKLKEGETSEPLKSARGWHVIRADQKVESGPQPFANVQREIRGRMESERSEHFQETLLDSLKKVYNVTIYTDSIQAAMKPVLSPAQLFAAAQEAPGAVDRIELFRRVVTEYPNDKSAVQAAFMIGFTYAEDLKDYPAARTAFQDFLRKYPKSDLVASANWMLENMEHSAPPAGVGPSDTLEIETLPPPGTKGSTSKP